MQGLYAAIGGGGGPVILDGEQVVGLQLALIYY